MLGKCVRWLRTPGIVLVLVCLLVPSTVSSITRVPDSPQVQQASKDSPVFIHLAAGSFDPLAGSGPPDYPNGMMLAAYPNDGLGYYIVQFDGPITEARKIALSNQGAQVLDYVPEYAFVVRMDEAAKAEVERLPGVRWIGLYQPAYRVAPTLLAQDRSAGVKELIVLTFPGEQAQVAAQIRAMGAEVLDQSQSARRGKMRIRARLGQVSAIAALSGVRWIEIAPEWQLFNNVATDLMGVREAWDTHGLYGTGQTVAVCDSGLDRGSAFPDNLHDDFEDGSGGSRVVAIFDRVKDGANDVNSGHGTHVAGSVLGNGIRSGANPSNRSYPSSAYVGLAPEASLVFQAVEDNVTEELTGIPSDLNLLFAQARGAGARIHTNSWGAPANGQYTSYSEDVDEYMWSNPGFMILFAAGNEGVDANRDGKVDLRSLSSPATAKNCITVGASENNRPGLPLTWDRFRDPDTGERNFPVDPINSDRTADDPAGMAAFSGRGPTTDGRYKPDLIAPGTYIASVRSSEASLAGWGAISPYYMYWGGTSMATPLTAGAATLVRQFYTDHEGVTPSAALIKATLINGATSLSPGQYGTGGTQEIPGPPRPNSVEGWGRVNIENSLFPVSPRSLRYTDHLTGLMTGGVATYVYRVDGTTEPLRVTLAWNDFPGTPAAGVNLVNDLDLTVTGPSAVVHHPADAEQQPGSKPGSTLADHVNNVEGLDIVNPIAGDYRVQVRGANVPEGPQPFALVVSGAISEEELTVTGIQPTKAPNSGVLIDAIVSGTGFEEHMQVHLIRSGEVITGTSLVVDTEADTIAADLNLDSATPGWWDVRVTNSSAEAASLEDGFFVIDSTLPDLSISKTAEESIVEPGELLTYTIGIGNNGYFTATGVVFTDTLPDGVDFVSLSPSCADGTAALPDWFACLLPGGSLEPGEGITYTLAVSVLADAESALANRVDVGGNERDGDPSDNSDEASVYLARGIFFLPLLTRNWPPIPETPVLNPISNPDGDGSYTVTWNPAERAGAYVLEEDDEENFSGPTTRFSGSGTSWSAVGRATGIYYYRVRATNAWGGSAWSNVRSVSVVPPSAPVLNPISNSDGDGDFIVSWNPVGGSAVYTLQEDTSALFPSPMTRYVGSDTAWSAIGKAAGTYYYRVRASNAIGSSDWSNVESVAVAASVWVENNTGGSLTVEIVGVEKKDFSTGLHYWRIVPPGRYSFNAWAVCGSGSWTDDFVVGVNVLRFSCGYSPALQAEVLLGGHDGRDRR